MSLHQGAAGGTVPARPYVEIGPFGTRTARNSHSTRYPRPEVTGYQVEYMGPSRRGSTCTCVGCGNQIRSRELRFGVCRANEPTTWRHFDCVDAHLWGSASVEGLQGMRNLSSADQSRVRALLG